MICASTQIDVMMQSNACDCNCWLCAFATSQYENEWCDPLLVINSMKDSEAYRIIDDPRFLLWY